MTQNRAYVEKIFESLFFAAKENILLRAHVEDRQHLGESSDINRGNFLELLSLRCRHDF